MANSPLIQFGNAAVTLAPNPIQREWILEGQPVARKQVLSTSADGTATMLIWDCTSGRFNWFYSFDESVYILEGSALIKEAPGTARVVGAGDTVFFPAGSAAEWTVDKYVRKVAFMRSTIPTPVVFGIRVARRLKRVFSRSRAQDVPMFG
jgi:uncharacterized cupin superfamily protein